MAGEHGTLRQYWRAHRRYGHTPPIPDWADVSRGDVMPRRAVLFSAGVSAAVALAVLTPVLSAVGTESSIPLLGSLGVLWVSANFAIHEIAMQPVVDWWLDIPRRGLPEIEFEYDAEVGRANEVSA